METGNLKAIVHIVTVATDKDPLIHLMAINSGGSVLYLYIHQVSQEKVQLNSSIKTFPRFSPKPPALKPGSNPWGGIWVADEELFPIETVLYVSKIIGVISTDNPDIGAAARSTLLHFL